MIAQICEESKCTGCLACMNLCPCGAITCQEREDGNVIPQIDPEKCIECHRCVQGCPENHVKEKHEPRQCYAAWQKDRKERKYSASGGELHSVFIKDGYRMQGLCMVLPLMKKGS
ncbi:NADH-quinone oxidoreductase subunit I [[Ruminococcus] lactaris]|uniref:NADH-quinone oxidoreductase subunit I n=1 Tax=[Ruminococcus] lactaris TaxID=46228 RepID=UPI003521E4D5